MRTSLFLILFFVSASLHAGALYSRAYGDSSGIPLLFLHGGPGYNSASFESQGAPRLAAAGFYVIVYDRRGEGRSKDAGKTEYSYEASIADIDSLLQKYRLKKVNLLGHSFGSILAVKYAEARPAIVNKIVLLGAPFRTQAVYKNVIKKARTFYENREDSTNLKFMSKLEKLDTAGVQYSNYALMHAIRAGCYEVEEPEAEGRKAAEAFQKDSLYTYAKESNMMAVMGFYANEKFTLTDIRQNVAKLAKNPGKLYAIWGDEDGLFSEQDRKQYVQLLGSTQAKIFDHCSHHIFLDRPEMLTAQLKEWLR
jgi:proline iminopeptidase